MSNATDHKTYGLFSTANNRKLIDKLESSGAKVFQFPPIETEKVILNETSINYLHNLTSFDWIIFPDVFAVEYFLQALEEFSVDFFELDAVKVCVFGEAVADRLRFVQLHADLIPNFVETENIFAAIKNYISQNVLENLRFLLLKETDAEIELTEILTENKAFVTELPIYQARIKDKREVSKLKTLLAGGAIDEFIFSSPTDIIALKYLFSVDEISEVFNEIKVSATDEVMFQMLKEHNQKATLY